LAKWLNPSNTKTYNSWRAMRNRCLNPKDKSYPDYGGRGISICDAWAGDYDAFFADMGEAPDGKSPRPDRLRWSL